MEGASDGPVIPGCRVREGCFAAAGVASDPGISELSVSTERRQARVDGSSEPGLIPVARAELMAVGDGFVSVARVDHGLVQAAGKAPSVCGPDLVSHVRGRQRRPA